MISFFGREKTKKACIFSSYVVQYISSQILLMVG